MKILILDNYDSFTYNLLHYAEQVTDEPIVVKRNDEIALDEINQYHAIMLSPGPGLPAHAGLLCELIKSYAPTKKILGICLGMQAIAEVFGGRLRNLDHPQHGVSKPTFITDPSEVLYRNIPGVINCGRYHSWVVDNKNFPAELKITACDKDGNIMSLRHTLYNVCGVQYHPESILTEKGMQIISNWILH